MLADSLLENPSYDPENLLDSLKEMLGLPSDVALARTLEVAPPVISKIRHRALPVGPLLLIRMHEATEISIRDLRILMGDRRERFKVASM